MEAIDVARTRLRRQRLAGPALADPVAAVRHLGAVQSQELPTAAWSLGERSGTTLADVRAALDDGRILRTHALRPTWHYLAAEDLRWVQALTGPRVDVVNGHYYRLHGLTDEVTARTDAVIAAALAGGRHLTRDELGAALAAAGFEATGNKLAYVLMRAELNCVVASGVPRGKQQTYALLDERLPAAAPAGPEGDEALAAWVLRYVTGHGPATVKDLVWWSSLTGAQVRRGLDALGPAVERAQIGTLTCWADAGTFDAMRDGTAFDEADDAVAHVLQGYDEYVVAYTESRGVTNVAALPIAPNGINLVIQPILVGSQAVGWWHRTTLPASAGGGLRARLHLARAVTADERAAIEAAFERLAAFLGAPVVVEG